MVKFPTAASLKEHPPDGFSLRSGGPAQARPCPDQENVSYNASRRSRSALVMTETDDKLIAAAAIMGESSRPVTG